MQSSSTIKHITGEADRAGDALPAPGLVPVSFLAQLLGVGERTVWRLHGAGKLPRPIRLGRSVRWRYKELCAWMDAGCPGRAKWQEIYSQQNA